MGVGIVFMIMVSLMDYLWISNFYWIYYIVVSGLLLGAVYSITKQPIAQAEEKAQKEAYLAVFPDAQDLTEPDNKEELLTEAADVLDQAGFGTADTLEDFYLAEKDGAVTGVVMNITSHEGDVHDNAAF